MTRLKYIWMFTIVFFFGLPSVMQAQKKEIISKLEKGQILEGTVKNITSYGVFVDLGGVDGLIHITERSLMLSESSMNRAMKSSISSRSMILPSFSILAGRCFSLPRGWTR